MLINPTERLQSLATDSRSGSISHRLRERRFRLFERLVEPLPRPLRILDIGGTNTYCEQLDSAGRDDVSLTPVNLEPEERRHDNIHPTAGDATAHADVVAQSYDVA